MHPEETHRTFLESVKDAADPNLLDMERFRDLTLRRSHRSAQHETVTQHQRESLSGSGAKALFHLTNYLGGVYHLTADEVFTVNGNVLIIRECKHTSRDYSPAMSDIKDGLFKLLLFSHLESVRVEGKPVSTVVELRLTSKRLQETIQLPAGEALLNEYAQRWKLPAKTCRQLIWLDEESRRVGIPVIVEGVAAHNG